ncbi:MAG: serine/threonine-protein kinase, partial [Gemmatimonadota bacterium]
MTQRPSPDHWERVDALFSAALDWSPEERAERLRAATGGDPDLLESVSALLEAASASDEFLSTPPEIPFPALEAIERSYGEGNLTGLQVGRYRIVRSIGRGGMASVWLAERDDGTFRRRVALKIVRRGLDTGEVLARFRAERQILSSLEHPNIARLYDGGSTEDGRPFLALEYVEGRPIDEYCDERRCSVADRLRLFVKVGTAVQFAHGRLVVHRDIKPSNILVTAEGEPKLLDFGIAKLLEPGEEALHRTRTGVQPLTPKYASPEQILGQPVTTASDVYQLGTLLYVLLTGTFPVDVADRSSWSLQEAIVRETPDRPSEAAESAPPELATRCGTTPARLARHLRGDLDRILLKTLEKEPGRRYASAIELVEDVRRHLEGRPIAAKRGRAVYRTKKYFRRHRWAAPEVLLRPVNRPPALRRERPSLEMSSNVLHQLDGARVPPARL